MIEGKFKGFIESAQQFHGTLEAKPASRGNLESTQQFRGSLKTEGGAPIIRDLFASEFSSIFD